MRLGILLLYATTTCLAALFTREDRTCDPLRNNIWPYTGFRLHRQYSFSLLPPFRHYMRLSHCANGRVNYEAYAPIERNTGMAWTTNMCGFTAKSSVPLMSKHERVAQKARLKTEAKPKGPHRLERLWATFRLLTERNSGVLNETMAAHAQSLAAQSLLPKPGDPAPYCYRAVRRKKFALRDVSLYTPNTFVGGLFMCPQNEICTNENAQPVMPLHSDDLATQWFEVEPMSHSNPLYREANSGRSPQASSSKSSGFAIVSRFARYITGKRHIIQRVPYFFTKSKYSRKDQSYKPPGGEWPEWAVGMDVNEDYVYSKRDVSLINRAFSQTINILARYFSISAATLPWESSVLDQLEADGEFYRKKPRHQVEDEEKDMAGDPVWELQRDILNMMRTVKMTTVQIQQLVAELQRPFNELKISLREGHTDSRKGEEAEEVPVEKPDASVTTTARGEKRTANGGAGNRPKQKQKQKRSVYDTFGSPNNYGGDDDGAGERYANIQANPPRARIRYKYPPKRKSRRQRRSETLQAGEDQDLAGPIHKPHFYHGRRKYMTVDDVYSQ